MQASKPWILIFTYSPCFEQARMSASEAINVGSGCGKSRPSSERRMHNRSDTMLPTATAQQLPQVDCSLIVPINCAHFGHFSRASNDLGNLSASTFAGFAPLWLFLFPSRRLSSSVPKINVKIVLNFPFCLPQKQRHCLHYNG